MSPSSSRPSQESERERIADRAAPFILARADDDAYESCIIICMRTTLDLDEALVLQAMRETGARSKTELLERGLKALLEREARKRLKALHGVGPRLRPARRRRP
jgi:Arc/MetJ family transcription regulator